MSNLPYGQIDKIITSDKGQSKGDMSVVYITFFEMDNPIALLVKTLIPSSIFGSLSGRAMPEVAIGFNDSGKGRQEKVNRIPTDTKLTDKLNSLLVKVFGNRAFKVREPSFSITFKGTENTPVSLNAVGLDIEGLPAQSTFAFYPSSAADAEAFYRAIIVDTSFGFVCSDPKLFATQGTNSAKASPLPNEGTSTGAVFASALCNFTGASDEFPTADLANQSLPIPLTQIATYNRAKDTISILQLGLIDGKFLIALPANSNNFSTHLIPLSILLQSIPLVNHIITSPPYEGSLTGEQTEEQLMEHAKHMDDADVARGRRKGGRFTPGRLKALKITGYGYSSAENNIGNLKSDSYLSAMLQVYQGCFSVLRAGGLMILVTKNFIRDRKEVRLDLDTIKLCEQAGFALKERWYRELPAQSFWRIIYAQRYPSAPQLKYEDILVFLKV